MALQLFKELPRNIMVSYWIVWDKQVNYKLKRSLISMVGYINQQDRNDHLLIPLQSVTFEWNDEEFPFNYEVDETITCYEKIKTLPVWNESTDC